MVDFALIPLHSLDLDYSDKSGVASERAKIITGRFQDAVRGVLPGQLIPGVNQLGDFPGQAVRSR